MVHFSPSIEQQKHFTIAKLIIWVWCGVTIKNGQIVYIRLLKNRLHGKAAEQCWANSRNNRLTTKKYKSTLIMLASTAGVHGTRFSFSFYHVVLVKFYCDVITRRHLQLINTSIDTFFSKLRAFLAE